jgi:hypothetical protein
MAIVQLFWFVNNTHVKSANQPPPPPSFFFLCVFQHDVRTNAAVPPGDRFAVSNPIWFACHADSYVEQPPLPVARNRFVLLLANDAVNCGSGPPPQRQAKTCLVEATVSAFSYQPMAVRVLAGADTAPGLTAAAFDDGTLYYSNKTHLFRLDNWSAGSSQPSSSTLLGEFRWTRSGAAATMLVVRNATVFVGSDYDVFRMTLQPGVVVGAMDCVPARSYIGPLRGLALRGEYVYASSSDTSSSIVRWNSTVGPVEQFVPRDGPLGIQGMYPTTIMWRRDRLYVQMTRSNNLAVMIFNETGGFVSDELARGIYKTNFALLQYDNVTVPKQACYRCATACGANKIAACPADCSGWSADSVVCVSDDCLSVCASQCGGAPNVTACSGISANLCTFRCATPVPTTGAATLHFGFYFSVKVLTARVVVNAQSFVDDLAAALRADTAIFTNVKLNKATEVYFELRDDNTDLVDRLRNLVSTKDSSIAALAITEVVSDFGSQSTIGDVPTPGSDVTGTRPSSPCDVTTRKMVNDCNLAAFGCHLMMRADCECIAQDRDCLHSIAASPVMQCDELVNAKVAVATSCTMANCPAACSLATTRGQAFTSIVMMTAACVASVSLH